MSTIPSLDAIAERILIIRGQRVLLDGELARLYGVETRVLIQAVKRNAERFPQDFMFQLTAEEIAAFKITNCDLKEGARPTPDDANPESPNIATGICKQAA